MSYGTIEGRITDIHKGESSTGKPYLGIKFETNDDERNPGYHIIRMWFTPKTVHFDGPKIARLFEFADLSEEVEQVENDKGFSEAKIKSGNPKSVDEALRMLSREEFVYLKININCTPNDYDGKVTTQYDIGWKPTEYISQEDSAFSGFAQILAERKAQAENKKSKEFYNYIPF